MTYGVPPLKLNMVPYINFIGYPPTPHVNLNTLEISIVPNIGDSRAVLGRFDFDTKKYKAIGLSRVHKQTEKDEAKRILDNE